MLKQQKITPDAIVGGGGRQCEFCLHETQREYGRRGEWEKGEAKKKVDCRPWEKRILCASDWPLTFVRK